MSPGPLLQLLYKRYGAFCDEIEKLLGEPPNHDIKEELKLLNRISHLYEAAFIVESTADESRLRAYFGDERFNPANRELARPFERLVPRETQRDLQPMPIHVGAIADRVNGVLELIPRSTLKLDWQKDVAYHFWLEPEKLISLITISETQCHPSEEIHEILMKTRSIIQKQFYERDEVE